MQATKLRGIINQQGKLVIEETINLNPGEVEVVILQKDDLTNIKTEINGTENKEENKINKPIGEIAENFSQRDYTLEELLDDEMEISESR